MKPLSRELMEKMKVKPRVELKFGGHQIIIHQGKIAAWGKNGAEPLPEQIKAKLKPLLDARGRKYRFF